MKNRATHRTKFTRAHLRGYAVRCACTTGQFCVARRYRSISCRRQRRRAPPATARAGRGAGTRRARANPRQRQHTARRRKPPPRARASGCGIRVPRSFSDSERARPLPSPAPGPRAGQASRTMHPHSILAAACHSRTRAREHWRLTGACVPSAKCQQRSERHGSNNDLGCL